jgi:hypothetical protein
MKYVSMAYDLVSIVSKAIENISSSLAKGRITDIKLKQDA